MVPKRRERILSDLVVSSITCSEARRPTATAPELGAPGNGIAASWQQTIS
jgi:hypothetical protein